ncbi:hypothetical protein HPB50_017852 [Hyalomma asiaticum]|uniref:Uncharacterized protein n=1 Tax=Hyalomma asiaticum TaxID=266040 RepID=A0ACB7S0S0_HYAAI|nr:hypothetical protein HPB50_017852 [Hyalomma asiaticum]
MFQVALFVLLCAAVVAEKAIAPSLFKGCVRSGGGKGIIPGTCTLAPANILRQPQMLHYAYQVMKNPEHQPLEGNINTVQEILRFNNRGRPTVIRLEFLTVESQCDASVRFSSKLCPARKDEVKQLRLKIPLLWPPDARMRQA